jgi:hypothetical protein
MAKDDTAGFDSKGQKDEQLEALKAEFALRTQRGDERRAKEVAAYAKEHHGETITAAKVKAEAKADAKAAAEDGD